ncbi:glycoside hydrolase family 16 protein [Paractinoplanes ferrugineus]|uniref:glycoside hydrolase family 16 protein n=1 Tax=Paractinoplanes ferrugineus TaxID=113564 RepID=UPI0019432764|nr:glycoside hydrolase family 16 protein [Actinoplanes ferrugineus]
MLKRVAATGVGLVLLGVVAVACGTDSEGAAALEERHQIPATASPTPSVSGAPSSSAPAEQRLGAATYLTAPASPAPSSAAPKAAAAAAPPNPAGWGSPVLFEDFAGPLSGKWGVYDSPNGTPARANDLVSVSGGMLHLAGGVSPKYGKDIGSGVMYLPAQKYGRYEVRFRTMAGSGYGAVVLLWPQNNDDWPTVGEIDLAEVTTADRREFGTFLHHGSANHQVGTTSAVDFTKFHTIAVEWLPNRVTYFLDGKKFFNVTADKIETGLPDESAMNLALQLDQGCGDYAGCRNASTPSRVVMDVDWVRIYQAP